MAMLQSSTREERILYWLSLDTEVRALAKRVLQRFAVTAGDVGQRRAPSRRAGRPIFRHSLEVASQGFGSSKETWSWSELSQVMTKSGNERGVLPARAVAEAIDAAIRQRSRGAG
jgi:hypothetical protein